MLSHDRIWAAIDALAKKHQLTPSGLARRAGLDPTSFNKSKRHSSDGRKRWPSTESVAKVLEATGDSVNDFFALLPGADDRQAYKGMAESEISKPDRLTADYAEVAMATGTQARGAEARGAETRGVEARGTDGQFPPQSGAIPLLGFAQAGAGGFFDDGGFPAGQGWDLVDFPTAHNEAAGTYALQVQGDSMVPLYRDGDILIIHPGAQIRRGDRVVVKTCDGEVMAKTLQRQTSTQIELNSLNAEHPNRLFQVDEVEWMARIIWASQ